MRRVYMVGFLAVCISAPFAYGWASSAGTGPAMIYLFLQSVVPTVPAGWLTFADGAVYRSYGEQPLRLWGLSATSDQQVAGAIMKTGGSIFLWTIIVTLWFRRFSASYRLEHNYRSSPAIVGTANALMRGRPGALSLIAAEDLVGWGVGSGVCVHFQSQNGFRPSPE